MGEKRRRPQAAIVDGSSVPAGLPRGILHWNPATVSDVAQVVVRQARSDEHEMVSALALRSKGHWGYSEEFLALCRTELTFDAATAGSGQMWVADTGAEVLGFGLIQGKPPSGELAALFVDPFAIGTGCGKLLLQHLLREAVELGFTRLELDADPGAVDFYLRFGAVPIGSTPSGSIPGRTLPHLEFRLKPRTRSPLH